MYSWTSLRAATHSALHTAHWSSPNCCTHDLPCGVFSKVVMAKTLGNTAGL